MRPDLHLLAEHHLQLSALLSRYRPYFILGGLFLAAGSCLLALDVADPEAIGFWVAALLAVGVPCFIPVLVGYGQSVKKVLVYEEGIAWVVRGRPEFHPWEDVRGIYRVEAFAAPSKQTEMRLVFKKKATVCFDQRIADFFQLAALVEALVTERLLPAHRQALDEGGADFGPVMLKRDGIRINNREFAWDALALYAIRDGGLLITPIQEEEAEEFASFATIPNYLILLRMLEEMQPQLSADKPLT